MGKEDTYCGLLTRRIHVMQVETDEAGKPTQLPDAEITIREYTGAEIRKLRSEGGHISEVVEHCTVDVPIEIIDRMPAKEQVRVYNHIWHLSGYGNNPDAADADPEEDEEPAKN